MYRDEMEKIKHVNDLSYAKKSLACSSEMSRLPVRAAIRKKRVGQAEAAGPKPRRPGTSCHFAGENGKLS